MAKPIITIVNESSNGDWVALYAEDVLVDQGHSLSLRNVLEDLGYTVHVTESVTEDRFPESLREIQLNG